MLSYILVPPILRICWFTRPPRERMTCAKAAYIYKSLCFQVGVISTSPLKTLHTQEVERENWKQDIIFKV
jgi:hypothetical protein